MKFKATKEQIKHLLALASNASFPMGMGLLHHDPNKHFTAADFSDAQAESYGTDYVMGRMVKCCPRPLGGGLWELDEPRIDYQSWASKYPTARDIIEAAGLAAEAEAA